MGFFSKLKEIGKAVADFMSDDLEGDKLAKETPPYVGPCPYRKISFGRWPKSKIKQGVTVSQSPASPEGYLKGSDGEQYKLYNNNYYRVEPIEWYVLKELSSPNRALLFCTEIIDHVPYCWQNKLTNDYTKSFIRHFINNNFYNAAFTDAEKKRIYPTLLKNDIVMSGDIDKEYEMKVTEEEKSYQGKNAKKYLRIFTDFVKPTETPMPQTTDKVFLLSGKDALDSKLFAQSFKQYTLWGVDRYTSFPWLRRTATDYAFARGACRLGPEGWGTYYFSTPDHKIGPQSNFGGYASGIGKHYEISPEIISSLHCYDKNRVIIDGNNDGPLGKAGVVPLIWANVKQ